MAKPFAIEYCYKFKSGATKTFTINLNRDTLSLRILHGVVGKKINVFPRDPTHLLS